MYNQRMPHRVAMIARWKPVHNGHLPVVQALCRGAQRALIGVGSANVHDLRNPFTFEETADMLRLALEGFDNYTLIPVPDLNDGPRWRLMVIELLGDLDLFVTDNPYVTSLLRGDYRLVRPVTLVPLEQRVALDGTTVRQAMARGEGWRGMVPASVADYITGHGLDVRFRREFGLQTLAQASAPRPHPIS